MGKIVKRGFVPTDKREFGEQSICKLFNAGKDLNYLLNRKYNIKNASIFVQNHYLLSERQRLALVRGISSTEQIHIRKSKEVKTIPNDCIVNIDGFNTIITLEVALSNSLLLVGMDGTIRDLASLRGTYRLIDKTDIAITLIGKTLEKYHIKKAVFYLDESVSNSIRLKQLIINLLQSYPFEVQVEIIPDVDSTLEKLDNVVTSDAIILDKCLSWINLNKEMIENIEPKTLYVDFNLMESSTHNLPK